jgi:hypothetical protein
MSGKSPISANKGQRGALTALAGSRDPGEADRARAILLTLSDWTSPRSGISPGGDASSCRTGSRDG